MYKNLNILRAILSSGSYLNGEIRPLHYQKILSLANAFAFDGDLLESLKTLELIGESQDIGNGYWTIIPDHFVQISDQNYIFVSSSPTEYLPIFNDKVDTLGPSRIFSKTVNNYPIQYLNSWIGLIQNTKNSVHNEMKEAEKKVSKINFNLEDCLFYLPDANLKSSNFKNWRSYKDLSLVKYRKIHLTKYLNSYYWCHVSGKSIYQSSVNVSNLIEAQFGIEKLFDAPLRVLKKIELSDCVKFDLNFLIIQPYQRLLTALCYIQKNQNNSMTFSLNKNFLNIVDENLKMINISFST